MQPEIDFNLSYRDPVNGLKHGGMGDIIIMCTGMVVYEK